MSDAKPPLYQRIKFRVLEEFATVFNAVTRRNGSPPQLVIGSGPLQEIGEYSRKQTDISDHLTTLFLEAAEMRPSLIVELGVRTGQSTFSLSRVADLYGSHLVSVDLNDCLYGSSKPRHTFIKRDDVVFASEFAGWCQDRGMTPRIDVLFIDTSHEFHHTVSEIQNWFPFLAEHCKVFFHDTNMGVIYFRKNGSMGVGWENGRGVIAAIEQYFGLQFDERHDFTGLANGWIIKHHANCSGLTILERVFLSQTTPTQAKAVSGAN